MTKQFRMPNRSVFQINCGRLILATIMVAPAAAIGVLFFGAPHGWADSTDSGIGHDLGLQVYCAFNPAFAKAHAQECKGIDVESVASNGGADPGTVPELKRK